MAYTVDLSAAAQRHLDAAEKLARAQREDVAGYLYGIAAECALKAMAKTLPTGRSDDIFYAHFPELRTRLRDLLQGRMAQPLLQLIRDDSFMNEWDIRMRYAPANAVREKPIERWAQQARRAVSSMGAYV